MSDRARDSEIRCKECGAEFTLDLTWLPRIEVITTLTNTCCPSCGSFNWTFTDRMSGWGG
jgi:DNA-directed RNA polymerase subunit RPC12/RpoP